MTRRRVALACILLGSSAAPFAADVVVNVITEAQIAPGVYGRVEIGKGSPPPVVVYPEPRIITTPKTTVPPRSTCTSRRGTRSIGRGIARNTTRAASRSTS